MTVRRYMTTDVISIHCDNHLFAAQRLMDWEGIRHLPVVDDNGDLVGLLSEQTLLQRWSGHECASSSVDQVEQELWSRPVHEVMDPKVRVVEPDTHAAEAAQILRDEGVGCLPVVNGRTLAGIVTDHDLRSALEDFHEEDELEILFERAPAQTGTH